MWNNLLFNEIPKNKVIRQINKIVVDKNLVITSLSDRDKRAIFDVLNNNAKTRIVSMRFEEDKNYWESCIFVSSRFTTKNILSKIATRKL